MSDGSNVFNLLAMRSQHCNTMAHDEDRPHRSFHDCPSSSSIKAGLALDDKETGFYPLRFTPSLHNLPSFACAELSALSARFSNQSGPTRHSLDALLAELDTFMVRFSTMSALAKPQYQQQAVEAYSTNSNHGPFPPLHDEGGTSCASTAHENLGQGPLVFDHLIPAEENAVVSSPSDGYVPTVGNTSQGFLSTSATSFQNFGNDVGMNDLSFGQSMDFTAQDGVFDDFFTLTQEDNAKASTDDVANIDGSWNDSIDFGSAANMQDIQDFGMPLDIQSLGMPPIGQVTGLISTSTTLAPTSIPAPVTAASQNIPRYNCTGCMKSYSRRADRDRHARSHNPNAARYTCPDQNCARQFPRKDKLLDHQRRRGH